MEIRRKPDWLKIKLPQGKNYRQVKNLIDKYKLNTICTSGKCPNVADCWGRGTATFMILGDICTRTCAFCATKSGRPLPPDYDEPMNIAKSVQILELKHCVLTSVDRDDLPDYGAEQWAETIIRIKELNPDTTIEALIPDFNGKTELIQKVINANPEVISHNLETVERLTPVVRSKAKYGRSLEVIEYISKSGITSKSGIMLGLGETEEEIISTMDDLIYVGCKIFTLGQYLQPTKNDIRVQEFVSPEKFEEYRKIGLNKGFRHVESSPLVRSSFHAEKHVEK